MQDVLRTDRLVLRHFNLDDAPRVQALAGNWKVASMLARVPYPYKDGLAEAWIATHDARRTAKQGYAYAIERNGELVGSIGLDAADEDEDALELGYWIGEAWWSLGIATEAARRLIAEAFARLPAERLTAGHFVENHASGRVLTKLGFRYIAENEIWSEARRAKLRGLRMELPKARAATHNLLASETTE